MPKVSSVEPQKKNPKRFNVFLDGKFAFGADEDLIVNYRLLPGKEILESDIEKLLFEAEVGKLMERMYGLFSVRMRSEREVRDYLRALSFKRKLKDQEELSDLVIELLIERLKQKTLINDEVFARNWVDARRRSKQKGPMALKLELTQKGISREIIDTIFSEDNDQSQLELAVQALEKRQRVLSKYHPEVVRQKALEFLLRRGFDYSLAKNAINQVFEEEQRLQDQD